MRLSQVKKALWSQASLKTKKVNEWFFKTGPGQYGYGDQFIGVRTPDLRKVAKEFQGAPLEILEALLLSKIHEERALALLILTHQYQVAVKVNDLKALKRYFNFYWKCRNRINNWDLVDISAPLLPGHYWFHRVKAPARRVVLRKLAKSKSMWDRRIAVLSTFYFLRNGHFEETLWLAEMLLNDPEDLMHKAVGWMLREVGKRDEAVLRAFLAEFKFKMPRTALRYSIEKFSPKDRKAYLKKD